jgi:hypothetical protein
MYFLAVMDIAEINAVSHNMSLDDIKNILVTFGLGNKFA